MVVPATASNYVLTDLLTPFLIMSIAALGLNVLTGYCGQLSLGTGAFMALGGFMTYKLVTGFPTAGALLGAHHRHRSWRCPTRRLARSGRSTSGSSRS